MYCIYWCPEEKSHYILTKDAKKVQSIFLRVRTIENNFNFWLGQGVWDASKDHLSLIIYIQCLYCKKVSIKSLKQAQFEISYFFHFYKICIRKGGFKIFMLIYVKPLWILCSSILIQVSCKYKTVMLPKTLRFGANFMIFGHLLPHFLPVW